MSANVMKLVNPWKLKTLIGRIRPFTPKIKKSLPGFSEEQEIDANLSELNPSKENDAQDSPNRGDDITLLEIS